MRNIKPDVEVGGPDVKVGGPDVEVGGAYFEVGAPNVVDVKCEVKEIKIKTDEV